MQAMDKGPGLFSDFGNKARDVLTRDWSESGVARINAMGHLSGDLATQFKYNNTYTDVKVDTNLNISATSIFADIVPSSKTIVSLKFPDYAGKLEVQYFLPHASLTAAVCLNRTLPLDLSVTLGTPTFALGAEAGFETTSGNLTKYTAGITVTQPAYCASLILGDKGDTIKASCIRYLGELKRTAAVGEITRKFSTNENTISVGGSYSFDGLANVKMKVNNQGMLGAILQVKPNSISTVTLCSEFETRALDKRPTFGLALALNF